MRLWPQAVFCGAQFVPGKTPKDRGGCTFIPGDDELSPNGYCVAWIEPRKVALSSEDGAATTSAGTVVAIRLLITWEQTMAATLIPILAIFTLVSVFALGVWQFRRARRQQKHNEAFSVK